MKKKDLIKTLAYQLGGFHRQVNIILKTVFEMIPVFISQGKELIISFFIKFFVNQQGVGVHHNPTTSKEIKIPEKIVLLCQISGTLKTLIVQKPKFISKKK